MMLYCHILGYTYTDDFKYMTEEEKREYCSPEVEVVTLSSQDVITSSPLGGGVIITPDDNF